MPAADVMNQQAILPLGFRVLELGEEAAAFDLLFDLVGKRRAGGPGHPVAGARSGALF